jgi:hypothetical protein
MKRPLLLALALIAALALFSLFTINIRSVAADEFSMYWASAQTPSDIVKLYFSPKENNPPGMALVQHFWGNFFGFGDASLRVLSLVITLAALWVLWKLVSYFAQHLSNDEASRAKIFCIAASTPLVWMSANIARYQGLAMLLGLAAFFLYVRWLREKARWDLALYAVLTSAMFYVHYLSAAVFALCAGLHYCSLLATRVWANRFEANRKNPTTHNAIAPQEILLWAASQVAILLVIVPIIVTIASAYSTINLGISAPAQSNKFLAAVMFFAATVIGIMNGFAIAPWTFWVVLPMAFVMLSLVFIALRRSDVLNNRLGWMLVFLPFVVMSVSVVKMYPPLNIYLIPSVQRVPFLAPLVWMFLGFALLRLANTRLQTILFAVILLCNIDAIATWNLNIVATQHTPPLQELTTFTRANTHADRSTVIAHTVAYRYGMEGVNSTSPSSKNAVERYLPEIISLYWAETDIAKEVTLDSCKTLIRGMNTRHWVIFQRNRYAVNATHLATALTQEGFAETASLPAQQQSAFNVWMKATMVKLPIPGFKDDAAPQPFLYTFRHFERK